MSLSPLLRQQLTTLVQAHDEGFGLLEREAVRRLAAGRPMTALQIHSLAADCYPAEIRDFLNAQGYQALYHRDLDRALSVGAGRAAAKVEPGRKDGRKRRPGLGFRLLRLIILAAALVAGGLLLTTILPKLQREAEGPDSPPATVPATPPVRASPPSPCLQSLRDEATAWCEVALTGEVARNPGLERESAGCGDRLRINSETVRLALDGLLEDEATLTYRYDEVGERCAAAAELAAP